MAEIDEESDHDEISRPLHVFGDEIRPAVPVLLGGLCKAVTRQIYQVPVLALFYFIDHPSRLDGIVIDGPGLARFPGNIGELPLTAEGIDEGRFAHIGPADKGDFLLLVFHVLGRVYGCADVGRGKNMKLIQSLDFSQDAPPLVYPDIKAEDKLQVKVISSRFSENPNFVKTSMDRLRKVDG